MERKGRCHMTECEAVDNFRGCGGVEGNMATSQRNATDSGECRQELCGGVRPGLLKLYFGPSSEEIGVEQQSRHAQ